MVPLAVMDQAATAVTSACAHAPIDDTVQSKGSEIVLFEPGETSPLNGDRSKALISSEGVSKAESGQIAQISSGGYVPTDFESEAVADMTDERLDRYIVGHLVGLQKNILALAGGLAEKKMRLARKGCKGKWSHFVRYGVGMSVSWADRLVRNMNRYLQLGARVRSAAELVGVSITKPRVIDLLQSYNAEFLSTGEPSEERFEAWVQALREAGRRRQNSSYPPDETETEAGADGSGVSEVDDTEQEEEDKGDGNSPDKKEKTVSLRIPPQHAQEFNTLIADLKKRTGTQDRPSIVMQALRCLARSRRSQNEVAKG
jgi:hypothetical protein